MRQSRHAAAEFETMTTGTTINTRSAREAHSEVMRELGVRRRCYGRWVADGKLSDIDAQDRLERLEKAAEIIEKLILLEGVPLSVVREDDKTFAANCAAREREAAAS